MFWGRRAAIIDGQFLSTIHLELKNIYWRQSFWIGPFDLNDFHPLQYIETEWKHCLKISQKLHKKLFFFLAKMNLEENSVCSRLSYWRPNGKQWNMIWWKPFSIGVSENSQDRKERPPQSIAQFRNLMHLKKAINAFCWHWQHQDMPLHLRRL